MGQLGVSSAQPGTVYQVGSKTDWLMPAAGATHTCALTQTGELHCWGDNAKGALGIGGHYDQSSPQHVGPGYAFVSAGEESTCAVKLDGTLWCWGRNPWGQLGNGSTDESTTPKQVLVP
jgi:alpha-tubulin suppressor-like RCC1 family protein